MLGDVSVAAPRVFLVHLSARPTEGVDGHSRIGGAYVNCWIEAMTERDAIAISHAQLRDAAWVPGAVGSVTVVAKNDYLTDEAGRAYFEQALLDGVVLVFHTWPTDLGGNDGVH